MQTPIHYKYLWLVALGWLGFAASAAAEPPVVVLMDTTAAKGVYDADNVSNGGSNARELAKALQDLLPSPSLHQEPISSGWDRQDFVRSLRPHLVIIHRSAFFHIENAVHKFGSNPPFAHPADDPRWVTLYEENDQKLIRFIGFVGTAVPQTQFLVYSRGTSGPTWKDTGIQEWLAPGFQEDWIKKIETRFHELKGRIHTMKITRGKEGSFRHPETRAVLRNHVRKILGVPGNPEPVPDVPGKPKPIPDVPGRPEPIPDVPRKPE